MGQVSKAAYGWNPAPKRDFSGGAYGVIYSTQNQPALAPNTPQIITLNTLNGSSGISLDNNKIVIATPATYRMSVTILTQNADNKEHDITFWLKFLGNDYPNSAHTTTLPARKSTGTPGGRRRPKNSIHMPGTHTPLLNCCCGGARSTAFAIS
jgi:hypothetical protein